MRLKKFIKNETVLFIASVLAIISMFIIHPDYTYITYIDFKTLAILFCLMAVVAGFHEMGVFDWLAVKLLLNVNSLASVVLVLVLLCFFLSMIITNDVALITFVPLTVIVFNKLDQKIQNRWMMACIVLQTVAANLGSMLTPIGNPQNLFLYGKAAAGTFNGIGSFIKLMIPYSICSLFLLLISIICIKYIWRDSLSLKKQELSDMEKQIKLSYDMEHIAAYVILFASSLLTVAHKIPYMIPLFLVLLYVGIRDRKILKKIDYSLILTFVALFIFIGNLGRISIFCNTLQHFIKGREMLTAILASQVMSNVPAAVLLEKFTDNIPALIVGTNLGGLGTLIASMASLISFKYIIREDSNTKGKYILLFTAVNIVFLAILYLISKIV